MTDDIEDPGWPRTAEAIFSMVPLVGLYFRSRLPTTPQDGLVLLRQWFVSFCVAVALFGTVFVVASATQGADSLPDELGVALLSAGAIVLVTERRVANTLDPRSSILLAASYRRRYFIRLGVAGVCAIATFSGAFLTDRAVGLVLAIVLTVGSLERSAPTRRRLRRDQLRLEETGYRESLVGALRQQR